MTAPSWLSDDSTTSSTPALAFGLAGAHTGVAGSFGDESGDGGGR
jgi:hypothetical protein